MTKPCISVIVLNYNGRRWLGPCLDALAAQQDAPPSELLVVDNASSDGSDRSGRALSARPGGAERRNLGFAGATTPAPPGPPAAGCASSHDTVPPPVAASLYQRSRTARSSLSTSRIVFRDEPRGSTAP